MEVNTQKAAHNDGSRWASKVDFFMAAISSTIGLGNLWRFPYICYKNGGGAFLIPFTIMIICIGFPLVTMDLTLGQFSKKGPIGVWKICPMFEGIGWAMVILNFICSSYYVMLMAYAIYFIFASFTSELPWATCNNIWNTPDCLDAAAICLRFNGQWLNETCFPNNDYVIMNRTDVTSHFPSQEYFSNHVLNNVEYLNKWELGTIQWPLALCLLLAWVFIVLGISLGTRSWGKISYVTAVLPYLVLLALLISATLVPGATIGILYFITPNWSKLLSSRVWADAAIQVFFSVGCCWGNFITLGRHNNFRNNPVIDAGILVLGEFLTSLFCGFVIFATLGGMATRIGVDIGHVVTSGPSLAFVVYPHAVAMLPVPQLWAVLFFTMLTSLGLGSAIPQVANILDIAEKFPVLKQKVGRMLLLLGISVLCYLVGLIYTTNGGLYAVQFVDTYGPSYALLFIGLFEVIAVAWIYGSGRFLRDLSAMTGWKHSHFFTVFWRVITPVAIICVAVFMLSQEHNPSTVALGLCLAFGQLAIIPIMMVVKLLSAIVRRKGVRSVIRPQAEWCAPNTEERNMVNNYIESTT